MQFVSLQSNSTITSCLQHNNVVRRDNLPRIGHSIRYRWPICGAINLSKGESTCIINAMTFVTMEKLWVNEKLCHYHHIVEQRPKVFRVSQWNINESPSKAIYQSF